VDLALYRCGFGDDYFTESCADCLQSGARGDRPTAFLSGEPALQQAFNAGVGLLAALETDDSEYH
jgi:hypothetical protein